MKKKFIFSLLGFFMYTAYGADALDLDIALQNTYRACVGIDESLHDIKVLAGINTAVTGVGTGLGVGAVATGFAKVSVDKKVDEMEQYLEFLDAAAEAQDEPPSKINVSNEQLHALFGDSEQSETEKLKKLNEKSKKLGNWRTGLLAGNTATNIAGAIISSKTMNKEIQGQIDACISATKELNNAILAAKINGEDISEAQQIYNACREYEYIDVSPINNRGKGAMISSSVGAGLGGVGTVTSAMANSNKVRNDNTDEGEKKEKNLNTASNVLAIGTTAASATATVFNATQIAAIKKVSKVSENCTRLLK